MLFLAMNLFYLLLAFIFCFGACWGSFLNVVIWRLPNKMSLSFPGSRCPKCGHPIRPWHNIPVLGWLLLQGKCFDCHEPISARYPVVEFLGGVGTVLIICPVLMLNPENSTWEMWFAVVGTVCLFLTLLAAGLILWDRNRVPFRLFLPALAFWVGILRNDLTVIWILPVLSVLLTLIPGRLGRGVAIPVLILAVLVLFPYFCILFFC